MNLIFLKKKYKSSEGKNINLLTNEKLEKQTLYFSNQLSLSFKLDKKIKTKDYDDKYKIEKANISISSSICKFFELNVEDLLNTYTHGNESFNIDYDNCYSNNLNLNRNDIITNNFEKQSNNQILTPFISKHERSSKLISKLKDLYSDAMNIFETNDDNLNFLYL
jgi:hypothetical protein